jgi:two-component system phosphate regulon sensor histidine kinase PhoR
MKLRKTYKFAFYSSSIVIGFSILLFLALYVFYDLKLPLFLVIGFNILLFIMSFIVIQYRVEQFIYKRVQKIYKDVSILDIDEVDKKTITSNMETLSKKIKLFAEEKHTQIESLVSRENYRREFLGNISHELKTPLFTVQGYILTLLEGAKDDDQMCEKYLIRANKGVERLNYIVEDLDLISKLETNDFKLDIETINIVKLIGDVFDLLEIRAKKRNVSLFFDKNYDVPILVKVDKKRLEQVLINLITNSIKYGSQNGKTIISIVSKNFNKITVNISDNGIGIDNKDLPRLFERFYRVDKSRSRNQGGSGLGLAIVKHILEAHNEQITVKSKLNQGSIFSFTLQKVI